MPNYEIGMESGCITTTNTGDYPSYYEYTQPLRYQEPVVSIPSVWFPPTPLYQNKKGDDNMRYLYEVILVNPKDDDYFMDYIVKKSEISALMSTYRNSDFSVKGETYVEFDDLKTHCRFLMEWKKEQRTTAVE